MTITKGNAHEQSCFYIGLRNMGLPMASNLLRAGHQVAGFDTAPGDAAGVKAAGISLAASVQEAVRVADAVTLPNGTLLLNVYKQAVPPAQQKRTAKHPQFWPLVTRMLPAVRLSSRKANNAGP